jgi:uncharacterized protein
MLIQQGFVASSEPSRYMVRLCYHFSKKIEVQYDEVQGLAHFPWGRCTLSAQADGIGFVCEADGADNMARVQHVIDSHVALFSRKTPLQVQWQGQGPREEASPRA